MKAVKTALLSIMLLITIISGSSCGAESVKMSMNYERPILTMARAVDAMDSVSYLNCFTRGAKQAYMESDSYNPELVRTILPSQSANRRLFKAKIVSAKSLEQDAIDKLEHDYKDKYKKRVKISKAQEMTVQFGTIQGNSEQIDSRTLTSVRIENEWFIFGDVIEEFSFSKNSDNSITAS